jgi:Major Facilitator Superfamily
VVRRRGVVAGCALGATSGWNFGNIGGIASELADAYGVGLATVGLLTTAMVVTHLAIQIPGGRASDRLGPARTGAAALVVLSAGNALALAGPEPALGIAARAIIGVGTGLAFISGSALVRESGGSPFAQGVFGGVSLAPGGLALAIVPQLEEAMGWRAPYWSALALSLAVLAAVVAASIVAGVAGTFALVAADPVWLAVLGALLVGLGAGIPFSPSFTGAAATRADAPAAAVGFVNTAANFVVLVGTPLLGLAFSVEGEGRLGFVALAALWLAALAVLPSARALGVRTEASP